MSDDGFIGLPPGFVPSTPDPHSGTVRRERPDRTRASSDEIVFFPSVPGMPAPAPVVVEPVAPTAEWRLVIPGQGAVPVRGVLLVGRNPSPTPAHPEGELLAITDGARSLSKTHAMFEVVEGVLWVHDLESTNGVWLVRSGEQAVEVAPGQRAAVPSGSNLELGDLVIRVERS